MSDLIPGLLYECNNHSLRFDKAVCCSPIKYNATEPMNTCIREKLLRLNHKLQAIGFIVIRNRLMINLAVRNR